MTPESSSMGWKSLSAMSNRADAALHRLVSVSGFTGTTAIGNSEFPILRQSRDGSSNDPTPSPCSRIRFAVRYVVIRVRTGPSRIMCRGNWTRMGAKGFAQQQIVAMWFQQWMASMSTVSTPFSSRTIDALVM